MHRVIKVLLAAAALVQLPIASASAATTYVFSGHANPTNSGAGAILTYIDRHAPITFSFTTASPLPANLSFSSQIAQTLSWTASGGSFDSTVSSTDADALLSRLSVSTDAAGDILRYNIEAQATPAALPNRVLQYYYGNYDANNVFEQVYLYTHEFNGVIHYLQFDSGLTCTNRCGSAAGRFSVAADAAAVPEPSSWILMIAGFGIVAAALRRRSRPRALAPA